MIETTTSDRRPVNPLPYGTRDRAGSAGSRLAGEIGDRVNGLAEFIGILIGIGVSTARVLFAIGLALFFYGWAGGRGLWFPSTDMAIGAFLVGLTAPLPWRANHL